MYVQRSARSPAFLTPARTILVPRRAVRPHRAEERNVQRSARSPGFFRPANTILVPGMYFLGLTRNSYMCFSDHEIPLALTASEYPKPSICPASRPKSPQSGGPCLTFPRRLARVALRTLRFEELRPLLDIAR